MAKRQGMGSEEMGAQLGDTTWAWVDGHCYSLVRDAEGNIKWVLAVCIEGE